MDARGVTICTPIVPVRSPNRKNYRRMKDGTAVAKSTVTNPLETERPLKPILSALVTTLLIAGTAANAGMSLTPLGRHDEPGFDVGAAEIVSYDPQSKQLYVVNGNTGNVQVLNISDPTSPNLVGEIDVHAFGFSANSVAVHRGLVAVAIEANDTQAPGTIAFYDADLNLLSSVTICSLPDMLTFTPDGKKVLAACEAEPNSSYTVDPEGGIGIVDVHHDARKISQRDVTIAGFEAFNDATFDPSVRIFGPLATPAQDFEPEYIAVSHDSKTAWVTLQENNAIATIDLRRNRITEVNGLGFKDASLPQNAFDASDKDGAINITTHPVKLMYLPDEMASFRVNGRTYLAMGNEGDTRDYDGFSEEARVADLVLDPTAFPNAADLQAKSNLGRLKVTNTKGDTDGDGDFDELYGFGGRSISIRNTDASLVWDSGDEIEQVLAATIPEYFDASNDSNEFDNRSDDKGPEPEGIKVGEVNGVPVIFAGIERPGGIMMYSVCDPANPTFEGYTNTRNFDVDPEDPASIDNSPEGQFFIPAKDSPNGKPLLVSSFEVSGTTTIYQINGEPERCHNRGRGHGHGGGHGHGH